MKKLLASILLGLVVTSPAWAAPSFDNSVVGTCTPSCVSQTITISIDPTCNNVYVAVGSGLVAAISLAAGVTIDGSAAPSVIGITEPVNGGRRSEIFGLAGSWTGQTIDVVITYADSDNAIAAAAAVSYCDVDQATPTGATASSGSDAGTSNTLTLVAATTQTVIDAIAAGGGTGGDITANSAGGQVERAHDAGFLPTYYAFGMSEKPGSASTSIGWTWPNDGTYTHAAVALIEAAAPPAVVTRHRLVVIE